MSDIKRIEEMLDQKIPRHVIEERDGGGGRKLSYLTGHYVIDRLNKVFGPANWSKEITEVKEVVNKTSRGEFPAYIVKVRLVVRFPESTEATIKEGYGYGADKSSQNAHELAIKEAVTDALKVAAKDLGMSMGLALYDKEQTNVSDGEEEEAPAPSIAPVVAPKAPVVVVAPSVEGPDPEKLKAVIRSHVKAAIKKGVLTMDGMKEILKKEHNADNLDNISIDKLPVILKQVQELTK